jgi:hypothetical protein
MNETTHANGSTAPDAAAPTEEFTATSNDTGQSVAIRNLTTPQLAEVHGFALEERNRAGANFHGLLSALLNAERVLAVIVFERERRTKADQRIITPRH